MQKTAIIILNKFSGLNNPMRALVTEEKLRLWFAAGNIQIDLRAVEPSAILAMAKQAMAEKPDMIVAAGGDGTVSTVASILCHSNIPLGVLPLGTLNHFAKDIGMPADIAACVAILLNGKQYKVDVGELNGQYFINNASVGLYPEMVMHRDQQTKQFKRNKWTAMFIAACRMVLRFPLLQVSIEAEQSNIITKSPLVFIGNNRYQCNLTGGRNCMHDGMLCIYIIKANSRLAVLRLLCQALYRGFYQADDFVGYHVKQAVIHLHGNRIKTAADGEVYHMQSPLYYRSIKQALTIIGPRQ